MGFRPAPCLVHSSVALTPSNFCWVSGRDWTEGKQELRERAGQWVEHVSSCRFSSDTHCSESTPLLGRNPERSGAMGPTCLLSLCGGRSYVPPEGERVGLERQARGPESFSSGEAKQSPMNPKPESLCCTGQERSSDRLSQEAQSCLSASLSLGPQPLRLWSPASSRLL